MASHTQTPSLWDSGAEVAWHEVHPLMMLKVSDLEHSEAAVFKCQFFHPHGEA